MVLDEAGEAEARTICIGASVPGLLLALGIEGTGPKTDSKAKPSPYMMWITCPSPLEGLHGRAFELIVLTPVEFPSKGTDTKLLCCLPDDTRFYPDLSGHAVTEQLQ